MAQILKFLFFLGILLHDNVRAEFMTKRIDTAWTISDIEAQLISLSESIQNNSFKDVESNVHLISRLIAISKGKDSTVEANAHYLYSLILRRSPLFVDKYILEARSALGRALSAASIVPVAWHQEYGSFLTTILAVSEADETPSTINHSTLMSLLSSMKVASSELSESSLDIVSNNIEVLVDVSHRLHTSSRRAAAAALHLAFHIAYTRKPPVYVRLLVLRSVLHHHKNSAGGCFRKLLVEDKSYEDALELLWVALAHLKSSYASIVEAERAVASFGQYTQLAAAWSVNSTYLGRDDLLLTLPTIPHWDIGFSGPSGFNLAPSLMNWNKVVHKLLPPFQHKLAAIGTETTKLTVGFVSSWFCNSAVGRLMLGLVEHMDREKFIVVLYHLVGLSGKINEDPYMTSSFKSSANAYLVVDMREGLEKAQASLLSLKPQVLVYTDIGMEPCSYYLASRRLALVQVVFWGHPFTSGVLDTVDYYILPRGAETDETDNDSRKSQVRYSEQLVRFDSLGSYYPSVADVDGEVPWFDSFDQRASILHTLATTNTITFMNGSSIPPNDRVFSAPLYASLQHCGKFHPLFDSMLLKILAADPFGVLLLRHCETNSATMLPCDEFYEDRPEDSLEKTGPSFLSRLGDLGVSLSGRVIVLQKQVPLGTLIRLFGASHVALEPFPFPASITSLDSFMAGTPVMAHGGSLVRHGVAQLTAMLYRLVGPSHRSCCIARNDNHFVAGAVELANNKTSRNMARKELVNLRRYAFNNKQSISEWSRFLRIATASFRQSTSSHNSAEAKTPQSNYIQLIFHRLALQLDTTHAAFQLAFDSIGCGSEKEQQWHSIAEEPTTHTCRILNSALHRTNQTSDELASTLQDVSGCFLWMYSSFESDDAFVKKTNDTLRRGWWNMTVDQVIWHVLYTSEEPKQSFTGNPTERDIDELAALSALFAHCALILQPRLVNAAAFGAGALSRLNAWDLSANLYTVGAKLKRPFFGDMIDSLPDWLNLARMNPFDYPLEGSSEALMKHPSTNFDLGANDGDLLDRKWRPFRRIQFGGYNSAYLRHLSSQLRHLIDLGLLPDYFTSAAGEIESVSLLLDNEIRHGYQHHSASDVLLQKEHVDLDHPHPSNSFPLAKLLALLGRSVYLRPTPALLSGALAPSIDSIREQTTHSFETHGFAVVDFLLNEVALKELREFCEQSTIFHKNYIQGYVGAFLGDGFGSAGLVHQIASDMKLAFPEILKDKRLVQAWAYKYDDNHERGIDPHSDTGQVSVNLWLTSDTANMDNSTGGLVIWPSLPPQEWSFGKSNSDTEAIKRHLNDAKKVPLELEEYYHSLEKNTRPVRIPFRENRCLIFRSRLFHQTDAIHFKPGFKNRRINVTFLFQ